MNRKRKQKETLEVTGDKGSVAGDAGDAGDRRFASPERKRVEGSR